MSFHGLGKLRFPGTVLGRLLPVVVVDVAVDLVIKVIVAENLVDGEIFVSVVEGECFGVGRSGGGAARRNRSAERRDPLLPFLRRIRSKENAETSRGCRFVLVAGIVLLGRGPHLALLLALFLLPPVFVPLLFRILLVLGFILASLFPFLFLPELLLLQLLPFLFLLLFPFLDLLPLSLDLLLHLLLHLLRFLPGLLIQLVRIRRILEPLGTQPPRRRRSRPTSTSTSTSTSSTTAKSCRVIFSFENRIVARYQQIRWSGMSRGACCSGSCSSCSGGGAGGVDAALIAADAIVGVVVGDVIVVATCEYGLRILFGERGTTRCGIDVAFGSGGEDRAQLPQTRLAQVTHRRVFFPFFFFVLVLEGGLVEAGRDEEEEMRLLVRNLAHLAAFQAQHRTRGFRLQR